MRMSQSEQLPTGECIIVLASTDVFFKCSIILFLIGILNRTIHDLVIVIFYPVS